MSNENIPIDPHAQAFPVLSGATPGMELRAYLAAAALTGLLANGKPVGVAAQSAVQAADMTLVFLSRPFRAPGQDA